MSWAFSRISEGLFEAISVARGDIEPARLHHFGPHGADKKKGGRAEAPRPSGNVMQTDTIRALSKQTASAPSHVEKGRMSAWLDKMISLAEQDEVSTAVTLTPVLAQLLLDRNPNNRNISAAQVEMFVTDMKQGRWQFNGEPVIVSRDGFLNDGQHRCAAVVAAGKSIRTMISFGFERETRMTLDQNRVRTVGNYVSMSGVSDGNNVAAVAGCIWQYKEYGRISKNGHERPTKTQTLLVAQSYQDIPECLAAIGATNRVGSKSVLAFCYWLLKRRDEPKAKEFIDRLTEGRSDLGKNDPIIYARNRLQQERLTANERAELIIRSWNAWRLGNRPRSLVVTGGKLPKVV